MWSTAAIALLVTAGAAQAQVSPDLLLLAHVKQKAAQNLARIPDYVCTETIQRSHRPANSKRFVPRDTFRLEVAHVGGRELMAWPGAGRLVDADPDKVIRSGAFENGTFAGYLADLFLHQSATFSYEGQETYTGRQMARFEYRISLLSSGLTLSDGTHTARAAMKGYFLADPGSLDLVRLVVIPEDIAPELNISSTRTEIDYARMSIGASEFLLPARAELTVIDRHGAVDRNITAFGKCRKYEAESTLSFDEQPNPQSQPIAAQTEVDLPAGIDIRIRLETPIDSENSSVGDRIDGTLERAAAHAGGEPTPAGSLVTGRIRRMERFAQDCFVIGLEFSEIHSGAAVLRFTGTLEHVGRITGVTRVSVCTAENRRRSTVVETGQLPGVGLLYGSGTRIYIPKGVVMQWRTGTRAR